MDAYDYYGEASAIAQTLEDSGHLSDARKIRSAMEEGSTGTEIFMMLRFQLEAVMASNLLAEDTRARAAALHRRLLEALS
ncbi:hypothetical protein PSP31121_05703 [Pandoraea sputorum]|uniref:Uncharacterized protein n=1 Tax=Pandoraea sputorum TaxID=93222 RepID=A0A5E5BK32_9BURK|nr:hypothetical protein PSP31121_05703 [Pandoraea sputorum]